MARSFGRLIKKDMRGKRVLLRIDVNIPLNTDGSVSFAERYKIEAIAPTVAALKKTGATIVLLSHMGRPNGVYDKVLSLKKIVPFLESACATDITFISDACDPKKTSVISEAKPGTVFLLENLRFYPGEDDNDARFARELAKLGDYYVNDAFPVCHRASASVASLPKYVQAYMGPRLALEIKTLRKAMEKPKKPVITVLGGSKIGTKISLIQKMAKISQTVFLGGGLANTCLHAHGYKIGKSVFDPNSEEIAKKICKRKQVLLPTDVLTVKYKKENRQDGAAQERLPNDVRSDDWIGDIGPETVHMLVEHIACAGTVIWNGPVGYIEDARFRSGTRAIINALVSSNASFIIGGGETVQAWRQAIQKNGWHHKGFISTGGGAMLEFMEGKILPGIKALETY